MEKVADRAARGEAAVLVEAGVEVSVEAGVVVEAGEAGINRLAPNP
jgi:hypothetical protein